MNEPRPDRLSASLKDLAEPRASDGFTGRVLDGLERRLLRRARRRAGLAIIGVVATVVLVVGALRLGRLEPQTARRLQADAQAQAELIRREHRLLQQELAELRRARDLAPRVLYLGGGDDYDLVLDLNPLLDEMGRQAAVPASFKATDRPPATRDAARRQP